MKIETLENRKLKLKNTGKLELFFVGIGSAFSKKHYQTALLIIKGKDHLLIDCGTKCTQALYELDQPITNIKNFLITHSHADHIGGLEEVALMGRYINKKKPKIIITETFQDILWNMSLKGGLAFNEDHAENILGFRDFWNIIRPKPLKGYPRETYSAKIGKIDLKIARTKHIPDTAEDWSSSFWSCCVVIDNRILFTSDTKYDPDLIKKYDKRFNFEAIFHDCQFYTGGVHASLDELNQLPKRIKKKIFLSHYGDNWEDNKDKIRKYGFAALADQHVYYVFD